MTSFFWGYLTLILNIVNVRLILFPIFNSLNFFRGIMGDKGTGKSLLYKNVIKQIVRKTFYEPYVLLNLDLYFTQGHVSSPSDSYKHISPCTRELVDIWQHWITTHYLSEKIPLRCMPAWENQSNRSSSNY